MVSEKNFSVICAFLAAALFGGTAPIAKILLDGIDPIILASLFYLGSGFGLIIYILLQGIVSKKKKFLEASLQKSDYPWLFGVTLFGGVLAPVTLMYSLLMTPAATASLLLNFEAVSTTIIAFMLFGEAVGKHIWAALGCITLSCIILTWNPEGNLEFSLAAIGILLTCCFWALDNNFSRNISSKDPIKIVAIKGTGAGFISLVFALAIGQSLPSLQTSVLAMVVGFFAYGGMTSVLFLLALRGIGTSRTGSLLAISPFFGVGISFLLFNDVPDFSFYLAFPIMLIGALLLIFEKHSHMHHHRSQIHEHRHRHSQDKLHHDHQHDSTDPPLSPSGEHCHLHEHIERWHEHPHSPDIHHRHKH
ncbi:EamA family transporter [Methanoplanus sp. FWC-SCC4]|uniref:EamA family transporter n=1 Tax=Methanochimaera problematica TaxID=2609417 RepID=A0AA97FDK3_9EURY|nr:EamA family transporter [Methanoplanus sp. FWC-SCC4]WOF16088.1 EamA family transporter [Methanoplanus sp. FWC-SCC4]